MLDNVITNYTITSDVAMITLDKLPDDVRIISDIFSTIAGVGINVDMITQVPSYSGVINLSFSIPVKDVSTAITSLAELKESIPELRVDVDSDNTKLSVTGEDMKNIPGVAANLFSVLADSSIDIKMVSTSEIDVSCLISAKDEVRAAEAIKKEFDL